MSEVNWLFELRQRMRHFIGSGTDATAEGRGRERSRRALLSGVTNVLAQASTLLTSLVSVPLTLGYLGKERYGLWGAIGAVLSWAALADFGMGRGLINYLSEAFARNDRAAAARYVSTAFVALACIACLLGLAFTPLLAWIPWHALFNVRSEALRGETRAAVAAVAIVFLINFPLGIVGPIYAGYQRSYIANLFRIAGNLLALTVLLVAIRLELSLPWLVVVTGGVPLTLSLVNLSYIAWDMPWLRPRLGGVSSRSLRELLAISTPLLLFQVGSLVINELQTLIIARRSGLEAVADYTIFLRVYGVPVVLLGLIDGPLLPAYREAFTRRDVIWLRSTFWRVQRLKAVICGVATLFYIFLGNYCTQLLSGQHVRFGTEVWLAAAVLSVVGTWNGSFNDLLVSTNRLWTLVWFILGNGVVTAVLSYVAIVHFGLFGVVVAGTIYSLFVTGWLFPVLCWRHIAPSASLAELEAAAARAAPAHAAPPTA